jgi:hypothetical protein
VTTICMLFTVVNLRYSYKVAVNYGTNNLIIREVASYSVGNHAELAYKL